MKQAIPFASLVLLGTLAVDAQNKKPLDLSLGWNYGYADQGNGFANLNGWYGTVNWEATSRVGIAVEHESFWGPFQGSEINQHAWLGGLTLQLRNGNPRVRPYLQPMGGATRSSSSGTVEQEPTFQISAGADVTLKGNLALEVVPAEYTFTHANTGAENSYQLGVGLQYSFGK